jgi:hypothetical protein
MRRGIKIFSKMAHHTTNCYMTKIETWSLIPSSYTIFKNFYYQDMEILMKKNLVHKDLFLKNSVTEF